MRQRFTAHFGAAPRVFRAPGRLNLIGEHTDYNAGLALPGAIDRACHVAAAPSTGRCLSVVALDRDAAVEVDISGAAPVGWSRFVWGAARALQASGVEVAPANLMIASTVPEGAGVSSSAALSVALVQALAAPWVRPPTGLALAQLAQAVERDFIGMPCGLMDQWASVCGAEGHVLRMDFQSQTASAVTVDGTVSMLVIDSGVRHRLTDGGYAAVRGACEAAAQQLGVPTLREAPRDQLGRLPLDLCRRARYVADENDRVDAVAAALRDGAVAQAGAIMTDGHAGLRDLFGVTAPETDALVGVATTTKGVFGARQMGGGFGGSVVALADASVGVAALETILTRINADAPMRANSFVARFVEGACEVDDA